MPTSARAAEEQGAKALAVDRAIAGIRDSTTLPLLWLGRGAPSTPMRSPCGPATGPRATELEPVLDVRDEDELEDALEQHDPEIFLISAAGDDDDDPLESVLELLPDVPAGKLAIADVDVANRDEVLQLERAGFDAVLVAPGHVRPLVGDSPPDV